MQIIKLKLRYLIRISDRFSIMATAFKAFISKQVHVAPLAAAGMTNYYYSKKSTKTECEKKVDSETSFEVYQPKVRDVYLEVSQQLLAIKSLQLTFCCFARPHMKETLPSLG